MPIYGFDEVKEIKDEKYRLKSTDLPGVYLDFFDLAF